jgi:uroporphyrinogen-III synthase
VSNDVLVVCLGETTAAAARTLGLRVDAVAARPTMAALVDAIEAALGARV